MEDTIRVALARWRDRQPNMASEAFRNGLADEIAILLREKGSYIEFTDYELDEQNARASWVCSICGENTFEVDSDYVGSGTNHLGCELKSQDEKNDYVYSKDLQEGMKRAEELAQEGLEKGLKSNKKERVPDRRTGDRREKNWLQKKHEDKVFGGDTGIDADFNEAVFGDSKDLTEARIQSDYKNKLSEEIVDNKDEEWIYESPDGGETVFRRLFTDYDPENKEEIDWKTKEPTGRKFTDYNNGNWGSKDNE